MHVGSRMISRTPREGEAAEADEYDRENENHKSKLTGDHGHYSEGQGLERIVLSIISWM